MVHTGSDGHTLVLTPGPGCPYANLRVDPDADLYGVVRVLIVDKDGTRLDQLATKISPK